MIGMCFGRMDNCFWEGGTKKAKVHWEELKEKQVLREGFESERIRWASSFSRFHWCEVE